MSCCNDSHLSANGVVTVAKLMRLILDVCVVIRASLTDYICRSTDNGLHGQHVMDLFDEPLDEYGSIVNH